MYECKSLGLGSLSDSGNPSVGSPVTITLDFGDVLFNFTSDSTILSQMTKDLEGMATIVSVKRPLFSDRLVVVFIPLISISQDEWINAFIAELNVLGFNKASLVLFEVGKTESSAPGGSSEIITSTTGKLSKDVVNPVVSGAGNIITSGLGAGFSSLWPVLLGGAVLVGGYFYFKMNSGSPLGKTQEVRG